MRELTIVVFLAAVAAGAIRSTEAATLPSSGRVMWLKANTLGLNDNDPVSLWADSSGNSNDATQSTAGERPKYVTSGIGGLPSVRFDGSDDHMRVSTPGVNLVGDMTLAILFRMDDNTNERSLAGNYFGGNGYLMYDRADDRYIWYAGGTFVLTLEDSTDADVGNPTVLVGTIDPTVERLYRNGSLLVSGPGGGSTASIIDLLIGNVAGANLRFKGDMTEVVLYNRALTPAEAADVNAYFVETYLPEPASAALLGAGLLVVASRRGNRTIW